MESRTCRRTTTTRRVRETSSVREENTQTTVDETTVNEPSEADNHPRSPQHDCHDMMEEEEEAVSEEDAAVGSLAAAEEVNNARGCATPPRPAPQVELEDCRHGFKIGDKVVNRLYKYSATVIGFGGPQDYANSEKIRVEYEHGFRGETGKRQRWCAPQELEVCRTSPRKKSRAAESMQVRRSAIALDNQETIDDEHLETGLQRPQLAAHERGRKMPQSMQGRGTVGTTRALSGAHKTTATKVSLHERINGFPNQSLEVSQTTKGKILFCRACCKEIENILGTIKTHVGSSRHASNLAAWNKRNEKADVQLEFLTEYYKANPNEEGATLPTEVSRVRMKVVEACMQAGVALEKLDILRPLLEGAGMDMTSSSHLKMMIPKIEELETQRLRKEIKDQKVCVIFDGTTRLGECISILLRWCPSDFSKVEQRLIGLLTLQAHSDAGGLAGLIATTLLTTYGLSPENIVCLSRDSCSTNGKAAENLQGVLFNMENILCVSHTLAHCGEHVHLPNLHEFMTPWLMLVQHHPGARSRWKKLIGNKMVGFSNTRWYSREMVCNELATNFGQLTRYMRMLEVDEVGDRLPAKMRAILEEHGDEFELELACNLDLAPIISACYAQEGDGLLVLLARDRIDSLLAKRGKIESSTHSMRNVAALIRKKTSIEVGTCVYELFSDVQPAMWYEGKVVRLLPENQYMIQYSDQSTIDQSEEEVRQWIDVRKNSEWRRMAAAYESGLSYLFNRMTGNLPPQQRHFDCSRMYEILRLAKASDPSWAGDNLDAAMVDELSMIKPLRGLLDGLRGEVENYIVAARGAPRIDHTETSADHTFTEQVLSWWRSNASKCPTWGRGACIVFAFTPNSAASERVFSLLKVMFGERQEKSLADYYATAVKLRYNKRVVG